jgi:hypothetical protein
MLAEESCNKAQHATLSCVGDPSIVLHRRLHVDSSTCNGDVILCSCCMSEEVAVPLLPCCAGRRDAEQRGVDGV